MAHRSSDCRPGKQREIRRNTVTRVKIENQNTKPEKISSGLIATGSGSAQPPPSAR
jgi:hypothetical protein